MSRTGRKPRAGADKSPGRDRSRLLKLTDAAEILGVSIETIRRRIEAGELPVIRDGRIVRVHPAYLDHYIAARRTF